MPSSKLVCPDCKAVLKPAKPVPDGKRVVCPRCKNTFTSPGAAEDELEAQPAGKKAAAKKAPAGKGAGKPSAPPPPPDEEEDSAGTYGVVRNPNEEEEAESEAKRKISYEPDLSIKDLRGPAQALVVSPSNGLMIAAVIMIILNIVRIAVMTWPFMFAEYVVDHEKYLWDYYQEKGRTATDDKERTKLTERSKNIPKDRKDLKEDEKRALDEETEFQVQWRTIWAVVSFFVIIYNAIIIVGAVKMQNVESYGWSMAAAIMAIFPFSFWLVSLPYGIWALLVLRNPKTIAGFRYKPD